MLCLSVLNYILVGCPEYSKAVWTALVSLVSLTLREAFVTAESVLSFFKSRRKINDIEDITRPRGDSKFLFECRKIFHSFAALKAR